MDNNIYDLLEFKRIIIECIKVYLEIENYNCYLRCFVMGCDVLIGI